MFKKFSVFVSPVIWRLIQSGNNDLNHCLQAALTGYTDMIRLCLIGGKRCCAEDVSDDVELRNFNKYLPSFFRRQGFYIGFKRAARIAVHIKPNRSDSAIELTISFFATGKKDPIVRHEFLVKNSRFLFLNFNEEGILK